MPYLLLICLMIACIPIDWPRPPWGFDRWQGAYLTGASDLILLLLAVLASRRIVASLRKEGPNRFSISKRYALFRTGYSFLCMANFAAALLLFGWGWASREICVVIEDEHRTLAPGAELLTLVPFFITLIGGWFVFYDAELEFHRTSFAASRERPFWSRGGYMLFMFRQSMLFIFVPLGLIIVETGLTRSAPEMMQSDWVLSICLLMIPFTLIFLPLLLPLILGLKRLPMSPQRERLEAGAHRLGLRYRGIMLWDTRHGFANALIAGILPAVRYLVFTDRLLSDLDEDEIEAVLGHEVGHVRHRHIPYYALFLILSLAFMQALMGSMSRSDWLEEFAQEWSLTSPDFWALIPYIAIGAYLFLAFGFLSRKCERQADIFGCRAVSCTLGAACRGHDEETPLAIAGSGLCPTGITTFIHALERVESINGMTRPRLHWRDPGLRGKLSYLRHAIFGWFKAWQHSTIPNRIRYLQSVAEDLRREAYFQWWIYLLRWGIVLGLSSGILALGLRYGWGIYSA